MTTTREAPVLLCPDYFASTRFAPVRGKFANKGWGQFPKHWLAYAPRFQQLIRASAVKQLSTRAIVFVECSLYCLRV